MSWIRKLSDTYDNCQSMIGYSTDEKKRPLLPVCHMTAQAHVTIVINAQGEFQRAYLITNPNDATTIIPCTEASGSRAGKKPECHPLCDQLQYVAGDFVKFGGTVTSGFDATGKEPEPYRNYVALLTTWCESKFDHPKARAVLEYVKRKTVVRDLSKEQILLVKSGKLITKGDRKKDKNAKDIFEVVNSQDKVFVRWEVQTTDEPESKVWRDKSLWNSWIQYYFSTTKKQPLCFVTGDDAILSTQHPKYIRAKGDGAKLISSNDTSGFTFRGRFLNAEEACSVGLDASQKAHSALQWLIDRQGKVFRVKGEGGKTEPGLTVVAWATSGKEIPKVTDDTLSVTGFDDLPSDQPILVSTAQDVAKKFLERMMGYASRLGKTDGVVVMSMDSASKGRLAITYYRENLTASDFLVRIQDWHRTCEWIHEYRYKDMEEAGAEKKKRFFQPFIGAPAPNDIAEAAYGRKADDKLKKTTVARILPCIVESQPIPMDLIETVVRRASNRIGMKDPKDRFEREWNKTLSIACALFRKYQTKEEYSMALDPNRKTRDYLYGRLLAIADRLEGHALYKAKEKRDTNAARYMQQFADRPNKTWRQIYLSLSPYMARLGGATYYKNLMDEVMCKFEPIEEFNSDKPLSGEFLLGYHCQRAALWQKETDDSNGQEGANQ